MAVVILPDVEAIVISYLLGRSEVTDLVGTRIGTALDVTKAAELPAIRVTRIAAPSILNHLRAANVQLESWATDTITAQDIAELARAVLFDDDPGSGFVGVHTAGVVTGVASSIGPRPQPDPETELPRWLFSINVFCHPAT